MLEQVLGELANRDWAFLIWSTIALIAALMIKPVRQQVPRLLRQLFWPPVGVALLLMCGYNVVLIFLGYKLDVWHWWMFKGTVFWFFGAAVVMFFSCNKAVEEKHYFRHVIAGNLKFAVAIDFVLNLYVFSLPIELILVPVLTLVAMLVIVAGTRQEFHQAKKLTQGVRAAIGIGIAAYVAWQLFQHLNSFFTLKNLEDYALPIVLTVLFLPFIYLLALRNAYESLYTYVGSHMDDDNYVLRYAKRQIARACKLSLTNVKIFTKDYAFKLNGRTTRADVDQVMEEFTSHKTQPENRDSAMEP